MFDPRIRHRWTLRRQFPRGPSDASPEAGSTYLSPRLETLALLQPAGLALSLPGPALTAPLAISGRPSKLETPNAAEADRSPTRRRQPQT